MTRHFADTAAETDHAGPGQARPGIVVRAAVMADAAAMNRLYNRFIAETTATFETEPISRAQREAWLAERDASDRTPVFVARSRDGAANDATEILGFANASRFDARGAYETSVKVSVFVGPSAAGRGVGRALYDRLFRTLSNVDVHRAYALIVAPNDPSVRLHQAFGFHYISTLSEVGRKFGRYHDVMWFEKRF